MADSDSVQPKDIPFLIDEGLLVFASVPPPLHGQSQMVEADLKILKQEYPGKIFHVDARWSDSLEEIGGLSLGKLSLVFKHLKDALVCHFSKNTKVLYYVPGPAKVSAVLRDIVVLGVLRLFYPRIIFHWHAIGQGEWATGSERLSLSKYRWLDRSLAFFSHWVLQNPDLSLVVSGASDCDARVLASKFIRCVPNGIAKPPRESSSAITPRNASGAKKILFFSRGDREKGILDALEAVTLSALENGWLPGSHSVTLAGGVSSEVEIEVGQAIGKCGQQGVEVIRENFVTGDEKYTFYRSHDLLLFASHWESFGLVVVEAMSVDLPVVATASDGVRGILGDHYSYLAPVNDIEKLAEKLNSCLNDLSSGHYKFSGRDEYQKFYSDTRHQEAFVDAFQIEPY